MKNTCLKLVFLLTAVLTLIITPSLYAASLTLTHIGSLATNGSIYSEWWYSATNPLLKGTANDNAEVTIGIDSEEHTVTADADGMWSYQTSMGAQDYNVAISSEGENMSFTLHAGQSMSGSTATDTMETTQSTSTVPPTGYNQIAGILGGVTLAAAGIYAYLQGRRSTKKAYAKEVLRSLR